MKKIISLAVIVAMGLMIAPTVSNAATYFYIDIYGNVEGVEATNSQQALMSANAQDVIVHSGVSLDLGVLEEGQVFANVYEYVDINGNLKSVTAATLDGARILATDRAPRSGFLIAEVLR